MPQWFLFLGIDVERIQDRLSSDLDANPMYFIGIVIALFSSFLDVVTYFIIRQLGAKIPAALFPFISGGFTSSVMFVYIFFNEPFSFKNVDSEYQKAILLAVMGTIIGWIALELMIVGLRISKSALASYAE
jgi:drug/metabolite transporter (DMT)-like permease